MMELTLLKIIQLMISYIVCFSLGLKIKASEKIRNIADAIWVISLIILWLFILFE